MNYYNEIKDLLVSNEVYKRVKDYGKNKSDLETYYNVGKLLYEAGNKYGKGIIKDYSIKLTNELGKGYSQRNLRNMRQFYRISQKWQTLSANLNWSHFCEILWFEDNKFLYYMSIIQEQSMSIRELRNRIKSKEYERLPESTKSKIISSNKLNVIDYVKNPILIKNTKNYEIITEKVLQKIILEDISGFLKELGNGFTFIDNEYSIKLGDRYNYIDLLLFNYEFNCFVVVELKVTELRKEHIGQIQIYMNYIDNNLRKFNQGKTIRIIISKQDNKYVIKYCSDPRIISRTYELV